MRNHEHEVLGSRECDVHPPHVAQKPDPVTSGRPHAREDHDRRLASLKGVHGVDLHRVATVFDPQRLLEGPLQQILLLRVGRDDRHLSGRFPLRRLRQVAVEVQRELGLGGVHETGPPPLLVGGEVEDGEGPEGGEAAEYVIAEGPAVVVSPDVGSVLEASVVEDGTGESGDGGVHAVLGVQHMDGVAGVLQALKEGAVEFGVAARHGKYGRGKLLGVAHQHRVGASELQRY
mmetsp:Transcript_30110/g.69023  ORF Transcript_30110/g.69023 Transcript_30110/m.69023 type:complete len:232 (-) Transcript_30110:379-1074(-)